MLGAGGTLHQDDGQHYEENDDIQYVNEEDYHRMLLENGVDMGEIDFDDGVHEEYEDNGEEYGFE